MDGGCLLLVRVSPLKQRAVGVVHRILPTNGPVLTTYYRDGHFLSSDPTIRHTSRAVDFTTSSRSGFVPPGPPFPNKAAQS